MTYKKVSIVDVREAYKWGYERGHHDTVENSSVGGDLAADEYLDELTKEVLSAEAEQVAKTLFDFMGGDIDELMGIFDLEDACRVDKPDPRIVELNEALKELINEQ